MDLPGAVPLADMHLDDASTVLARAFAEDPGLVYVLPDPVRRTQLAPKLAGAGLRYAVRCGSPLVTVGHIRGVAIWFAPDAAPPSEADVVDSGISAVPETLGSESWERLKCLLDHLDELHAKTVPEPHWYLTVLAVDPAWQRRGIGMALMQPVFDVADRDGVACYLESPTAENTRYYGQRGFRTIDETIVPGSDFTISLMVREPLASNALEPRGAQ